MPGDAVTPARLIEPGAEVRSEAAIEALRSARGGWWPAIRWTHRRRPLLTAIIVLAALVPTLVGRAQPYDLLEPAASPRFVLAWMLVFLSVFVRLWGSGNLRKNQEITDTGIYRLVRHPLYVGNLSFLLAFFLTVGDPAIGIALFLLLVVFVYYPTMLGEEEYLTLKFPRSHAEYRPPPRLLPDPRRLPEAISSDRFEFRTAYSNLGFRSLWFVIGLPLLLRALRWIQEVGVPG